MRQNKLFKLFLLSRQILQAIVARRDLLYHISGVLSRYPKIEIIFPRIAKRLSLIFQKHVPDHFKKVYEDHFAGNMANLAYDAYLSFFFHRDYIPKPSWQIVDVGAFKGLYSFLCAEMVGEKGRVIGVEPNKKLFVELQKELAQKQISNLVFIGNAISERNGAITLNVSDTFPSTSSLFPAHTAAFDPSYKNDIVDGISLDHLIQSEKISTVDLVKIDVEGAELDVLKGAVRSLKQERIKRLIIEVHQDVVRLASVKKYLKRLKYRIDASVAVVRDRSFVYARLK